MATYLSSDKYIVERGPEGSGTMIINMGPQHPSTHGVLRLQLELDGENVVSARPVIGYLHTGIEKELEHKRYVQSVTLTDRMDYLAPLSNNLVYCLAIEKMLDIEVPPRAQVVRVMLAELTRLNSHLVWLGTHAMDIGAQTVFLYCFREREELLKIYEHVAGQRMMTTYFRPGGLMADIPEDGFRERIRAFLDKMPTKIDEYETLLTNNPIWRNRTEGVGVIGAEDAADIGLTGPALRASGVDWDLRRDNPYSGYENYDFHVPTRPEGDTFARYVVRNEEMRQAIRIAQQALDSIPEGPYKVEDRKISMPPRRELETSMEAVIHHFKLITEGFHPPKGEVYQGIESPKGEIGVFLISDGSNRPWRVKVRPPCFVNLQALPKLIEGRLLADVVACIGTIDIVLGEVDR
jgi:NADH-quinone oxidoreductase subunit D